MLNKKFSVWKRFPKLNFPTFQVAFSHYLYTGSEPGFSDLYHRGNDDSAVIQSTTTVAPGDVLRNGSLSETDNISAADFLEDTFEKESIQGILFLFSFLFFKLSPYFSISIQNYLCKQKTSYQCFRLFSL